MVTYVVNYTDTSNTPIGIEEKTVDRSLPIALFGRRKLEYGEEMNENILHLLENFACPEDASNPGNPDLLIALDNTLANAIEGQLWYNSTQKVLYMRTGGVWIPFGHLGEVASNFGTMVHGGQLPLPVSDTGYTFTYDECHWIVGPRHYIGEINTMICTTDANAFVNHTYSLVGGGTVNGTANYMIIGIRNALTQAPNVSSTPSPSLTQTPTPTPTITVTPTMTQTEGAVTPTPTPSPNIFDPAIIWGGGTIENALSSSGYVGNIMTFRSDSGGGPSGQANMEYWKGTSLYEGWVDYIPVLDGEFLIRFIEVSSNNLGAASMTIQDGLAQSHGLGDEFDANGAQFLITNQNLAVDQTADITMLVGITSNSGGPFDGMWVERTVTLSVTKTA